MTKICNKCGKAKPCTAAYFPRLKGCKDGLRPVCKECMKIYHAQHYKNCYKERHQKLSKINYLKNKKQIIERRDQWRKDNPEKYKSGYLEQSRNYYKNNKDKILEWGREYSKNNPLLGRVRTAKRRAKKRDSLEHYTVMQINEMLLKQGHRCNICDAKFDVVGYHIDHIIPISRKGVDTIDNIQLLCPYCNLSKGNKTMSEFAEYLKEIS